MIFESFLSFCIFGYLVILLFLHLICFKFADLYRFVSLGINFCNSHHHTSLNFRCIQKGSIYTNDQNPQIIYSNVNLCCSLLIQNIIPISYNMANIIHSIKAFLTNIIICFYFKYPQTFVRNNLCATDLVIIKFNISKYLY